MLSYLEFLTHYFNLPITAIIIVISFLLIANIIGEILELKGKMVPEIMKLRKYFVRKKTERETLEKLPETFDKVETLLNDVNQHYNEDNIARRNEWIECVNKDLKRDNEAISDIQNKVDNIENVLYNMDVQNKRRDILSFAERVVDETYLATYESFEHISNVWSEYEQIIKERGISNGVVEKSVEIIKEEYERRLREGQFVESMRNMDFAPKINFFDK